MDKNNLLYKQVEDYILDKVNNRVWLPGYQLPTEKELAEQFKVSKITTKRAMENLVRDGIIYRKKGHGSFIADNSVRKTKNTQRIISMIIPYDSSRPELLEYINGATDFLSSRNYYLTLHCTEGENVKKEREFLQRLPKEGISGIIYYPLNLYKEFDILMPMYLEGYPIVTIDKYMHLPQLSSVVSDNVNAAYDIMMKLFKDGHRNIAFISRSEIGNASSIKERFMGYCKAYRDNGIQLETANIITDYTTQIKDMVASDRLIYLCNKLETLYQSGVTAIFIENDPMLIKAIINFTGKAAVETDKLCVAGFDGIVLPEHLNIPVLVAEQNFHEIGWKAAEWVWKKIEKGNNETNVMKIPVKIESR